MDFRLTPEQMVMSNTCTLLAEKVIAPNLKNFEEDPAYRLALFQNMAQMGLYTLCVPKKEGGTFTDTLTYILALKAIAKIDAGISVAMAVTNMVAETISRFGTEEQKQKYIPLIAQGLCVPLSFALTEKNAGSDAKAIQVEARRDPSDRNYYLINGEKQFITNGDISSLLIVMAKTMSNGSEGITAFLVDRSAPGMSVIKTEDKLGLLTVNLVSLRFEDCRIPASEMLGQEGQGLKIALSSLDSGRIGVAAQSVGIAEAAFEAALHHAKERYQFGHAIGDNQAIAFKLADMRVLLNAAELMVYKSAWVKDQGGWYSEEASEAKLFCSEACKKIADEALQIFGGYGYIKDYPVERYFRDARVTTLYEGTSEIQRIVISRHLLREI